MDVKWDLLGTSRLDDHSHSILHGNTGGKTSQNSGISAAATGECGSCKIYADGSPPAGLLSLGPFLSQNCQANGRCTIRALTAGRNLNGPKGACSNSWRNGSE